MSYRDPSGNIKGLPNFSKLIKHMVGGIKIADKAFKSAARGLDHSVRNFAKSDLGKDIQFSIRKIGRAIDGGARWLVSGGKYSRNRRNDLDRLFNTEIFRNIEKDIQRITFVSEIRVNHFIQIATGIVLIFFGLLFGWPILIVGGLSFLSTEADFGSGADDANTAPA